MGEPKRTAGKHTSLRRYVRFSLRTFMIAVTLFAVWLSVFVHHIQQQREIVHMLETAGVRIEYDVDRAKTYWGLAPPRNDSGFDLPSRLNLKVRDVLRPHVTRHALDSVVSLGFYDSSGNRSQAEPIHTLSDEDLKKLRYLRDVEVVLLREDASDDELLHACKMRSLRVITGGGSPSMTDSGLANLNKASHLEELALRGCNRITIDALRGVRLPRLKHLAFPLVPVTDADVDILLQFPSVESLEFDLQVTGQGLQKLSALPNLRYLRLPTDGFSDSDWTILQQFNNLQSLDLSDSNISDSTFPQTARLASIERLYLLRTGVTATSIEHLIAMPGLKVLRLDQRHFTAGDLNTLKAGLPTCDIKLKRW